MRFRKKPVTVEAKRVSRETLAEISPWCGGEREGNTIRLRHGVVARLGDWILQERSGHFYVYSQTHLYEEFDEV